MFKQNKKYQKGGVKKLTPGDIKPAGSDIPILISPDKRDELLAAQKQAEELAKRKYIQADRTPVNYERRNQLNKQNAEAQGLTTDSQGRVSTLFNANSKGYNLLHNAGDVLQNTAEVALALDGVGVGSAAKGIAGKGSAEALPSVTKPKELLDWFLGRRTAPPSGQQWLDEWMNDPITAKKISDRAGIKPEMPDYIPGESSSAMKKRFEDYQIKKASARPTYVRTDVKDVPIRNYDDLKNHNPNIHAAYNTTSGGVSLGDGNIFINDKMYRHMPREKEKAIVHELTHRAEFNDAAFTNKERQELSAPFGKDGTQGWDGNLKEYNDTYFTNPTEIHARMNEARYDLGLKPSDEFTEAHYNKVMKDNKFSGMGPHIKDKSSFIKLMNNFWAVPPAIGVGAALNQKEQGGFSTLGYKKNSKDKNNPYNVIPSNRITMQDVPHPVMGISDSGEQRLMMPGEEHQFSGNQVLEIPIRQMGGTLPPVTVVTHRDKETRDYYKHLQTDVDPYTYSAFMDMGKKYGFPKIRKYDEENEYKRGEYDVLTNTIKLANNRTMDDNYTYFDELAHKVQVDTDLPGFIGKQLKTDIWDRIMGKDQYIDHGSMEYEAHHKIAPKLRAEFQDKINNSPDYIPMKQIGGYQQPKGTDLSYMPAFANSFMQAIATRVNNNRDNAYQQNNLTNPLNYLPQINNANPYETLGVQQYQQGGEITDSEDLQDEDFLYSSDEQPEAQPAAQEAPEEVQQPVGQEEPEEQGISIDTSTPDMQDDNEPVNPETGQPVYAQAPTSMDADLVAQESGGDYKAENPHSSAVGKYQFLWNQWSPSIKAITGVADKEAFKNNPQAQENFYSWYKQSHMAPAIERLKSYNTKGLSDAQLGKLYHFKGEAGAQEWLTSGVDKTRANNTSIEHYIGKS